MSARYYTKPGMPDTHWAAFYPYAMNILGRISDGRGNANELFKDLESILKTFNGKIIWPDNDDTKWHIECLEFETEEDLLYFKLRFNRCHAYI